MFESQTLALIALLAAAWGLQFWMTNRQTRAFHNRSQELRRTGDRMAVGMAGSNWKRKTYVILVVDDTDRVTAAEVLSGFTVFARAKPSEGLVGTPLERVGAGEPPAGIPEKTWKALGHAAGLLRKGTTTKEVG